MLLNSPLFTATLSFNDYVDICQKEHQTSEDDLLRAFQKIDINGDGYISNRELKRVLTAVSTYVLVPKFDTYK